MCVCSGAPCDDMSRLPKYSEFAEHFAGHDGGLERPSVVGHCDGSARKPLGFIHQTSYSMPCRLSSTSYAKRHRHRLYIYLVQNILYIQKGLSWGLGFCTPHFRILFSTCSVFVVQGCFACFGRPCLQSYTCKTPKPYTLNLNNP